jgi:hypothetical protein
LITSKVQSFVISIAILKEFTMQGLNRVKTVLGKGEVALGVWQLLPGSNMSRTLARAGYDWVLVDCEHGNIDGQSIDLVHISRNNDILHRCGNA